MSTLDPGPTATTGHLSARRRWSALAVLSASLLVVVMDMTILNVALPEMTAALAPNSAQQLWIVDVYALVLAGLLVTMSTLGDRWGRKRTLLAGFAIFGGASLLILVAESAEAVIAVRALLGVGGAMIMPLDPVHDPQHVHRPRRARPRPGGVVGGRGSGCGGGPDRGRVAAGLLLLALGGPPSRLLCPSP